MAKPTSPSGSINMDEIITQEQINQLLTLNEFISSKKSATRQLIKEIKSVILDSGKLELEGWRTLRAGLRELEDLIPVIDMIIKLKGEVEEPR